MSDYRKLKSIVVQSIIAKGWVAVDEISMKNTTTACIKDFPTAVGLKRAFVYLGFQEDNKQFALTASYDSQGRNILANIYGQVSCAQSSEDIYAEVIRFSEQIEATVADSYAAKLLNTSS